MMRMSREEMQKKEMHMNYIPNISYEFIASCNTMTHQVPGDLQTDVILPLRTARLRDGGCQPSDGEK